jgi:hypothetical protein
MRFNRLKSLFIGTLFSLLIVLGLGLAGATGTLAQVRRAVVRPRVFVVQRPFSGGPLWWGPGYYGSYYGYYDPIAYQRERGFSDGFSRGRNDARHSKAYDPNSHKHYRNASSITYRNAFLQGYSTAFRDERVR